MSLDDVSSNVAIGSNKKLARAGAYNECWGFWNKVLIGCGLDWQAGGGLVLVTGGLGCPSIDAIGRKRNRLVLYCRDWFY